MKIFYATLLIIILKLIIKAMDYARKFPFLLIAQLNSLYLFTIAEVSVSK